MPRVDRHAALRLRLYRLAVEQGARRPLGSGRFGKTARRPRVGYYLWRFPSLTGTYVHREIGALRQAGLDVEVFADIAESDALLDAEARAFVSDTRYLLPIDAARLRSYRRRLLRRDPLGVLNAFAYTALHRYAGHKDPAGTGASFATRSTSPGTRWSVGLLTFTLRGRT